MARVEVAARGRDAIGITMVGDHGFEDPRNKPASAKISQGEKVSRSKQQSLFLRVKSQELETVEVCLAHAEDLD